MSPDTVRLLTSGNAVIGYLIGVVGLLVIGFGALARPRPVAIGGVVIAAAGVAAVARVYTAPIELLGGVALLVVAGLIPTRADIATMAACLPGAAMLGYSFVDSRHPWLIVFVVAGATVLGPLAGRFDSTHSDGTGTSLMVVAYAAALLLVPDTDWVIVTSAAAIPIFVAGIPWGLARLGKPGALAATGLLLWMTAQGASARPSVVAAGAGVLGLLIADPVARWTRSRVVHPTRVDAMPVLGVGVQIALGVALAALVGVTDQPLLVGVVALSLLAAGGLWSSSAG